MGVISYCSYSSTVFLAFFWKVSEEPQRIPRTPPKNPKCFVGHLHFFKFSEQPIRVLTIGGSQTLLSKWAWHPTPWAALRRASFWATEGSSVPPFILYSTPGSPVRVNSEGRSYTFFLLLVWMQRKEQNCSFLYLTKEIQFPTHEELVLTMTAHVVF